MEDLSSKSNFKKSSVPPKSGMKDMLKKPEYAKNKVYDKKSGTGRGKEFQKEEVEGSSLGEREISMSNKNSMKRSMNIKNWRYQKRV